MLNGRRSLIRLGRVCELLRWVEGVGWNRRGKGCDGVGMARHDSFLEGLSIFLA